MPTHTQTVVLQTHTTELLEHAVATASRALRAGEVIALPTETVYGLAANALDPVAVSKIFKIKGRPSRNPIIVHVASLDMAKTCVSRWSDLASKLSFAFWPGPLTLILPRASCIPDIVTARGSTVGVRWPSHPIIQAIIRECGFPLAAPSANLSNQISATLPEHVLRSLGDRIPLVVDGGPCQVGIESTVLDLTVYPPAVLRPGMIGDHSLKAVVRRLKVASASGWKTLRSPGLLRRHYAPKARLVICQWQNDQDLERDLNRYSKSLDRICVIAHTRIPSVRAFLRVAVIPHDPEAFARAIYAELHACDDAGAELIVVESLPESPEWFAITDRLQRGTH